MNDSETLSKWIMNARGIKKTAVFCRETGISATSLAAWDKGLRLPSRKKAEQLLTGTNLTPDDLFARQKALFPHLAEKKPRKPKVRQNVTPVEPSIPQAPPPPVQTKEEDVDDWNEF